MKNKYIELAQRVAASFAARPEVEAVALGGSLGGKISDAASDIDLYVYTYQDIPLEARIEIMERSGDAKRASMGLNFWGSGDEWFDAESGIEVDIIYFDVRWMEGQIKQVVWGHQPSMDYSTCLWYTIQHSKVIHDPNDWFAGLQETCQQPYPERLRANIIAHNHPVLREIIPSYFLQIAKAVKRADLVSVNHRLAGLLASYFDILFAINRMTHPGEKRLVEKAVANCAKLPENMEADITAVLGLSVSSDPGLLERLDQMLDRLDDLLAAEGFGRQQRTDEHLRYCERRRRQRYD